MTAEQGISAGTRRVEALTGEAAINRAREDQGILEELEQAAKTGRRSLVDEYAKMRDEIKDLRRRNDELKRKAATAGGALAEGDILRVGDVQVWTPRFDGLDRKAHAAVVDDFRNRHRDAPFALVSTAVDESGVHVISAVSDSLKERVKAPEVMKRLGLRGGGRPDFAQGGGVGAGGVDDLGKKAVDVLKEMLAARRSHSVAEASYGAIARDGAAIGGRAPRSLAARSSAPPPKPRSTPAATRRASWRRPTSPPPRAIRLTYPGKGKVIHSTEYRLRRSYNGEFDQHIAAATAAYNVDLELVRAIIQVESDFDHLARSSKGAMGLMQLMPATAARFGVPDPWNPRQNIFGGVQYLRVLLDMFGGDVELVAAAYNAGENAVLRYNGVPPYRETRGYVAKVQSLLGGRPSLPWPA